MLLQMQSVLKYRSKNTDLLYFTAIANSMHLVFTRTETDRWTDGQTDGQSIYQPSAVHLFVVYLARSSKYIASYTLKCLEVSLCERNCHVWLVWDVSCCQTHTHTEVLVIATHLHALYWQPCSAALVASIFKGWISVSLEMKASLSLLQI